MLLTVYGKYVRKISGSPGIIPGRCVVRVDDYFK